MEILEIRQIDFARLAGTTKNVIYEAIKADHIAINEKTRKVIFDDPITQFWYQKQIAKNIKAPQGKSDQKAAKSDPSIGLIALHREKLEQEIGKIKADKRLKELQYALKRETLIEKDTVAAVLFQYIDALNINMLDVPDMIIDSVIDKVSAGASRGDIIKLMRDMIQKAIVNTKKQIKDRLKQTLNTF